LDKEMTDSASARTEEHANQKRNRNPYSTAKVQKLCHFKNPHQVGAHVREGHIKKVGPGLYDPDSVDALMERLGYGNKKADMPTEQVITYLNLDNPKTIPGLVRAGKLERTARRMYSRDSVERVRREYVDNLFLSKDFLSASEVAWVLNLKGFQSPPYLAKKGLLEKVGSVYPSESVRKYYEQNILKK